MCVKGHEESQDLKNLVLQNLLSLSLTHTHTHTHTHCAD